MLGKCILLLLLVVHTWEDIRGKRLSGGFLIAAGVAAIIIYLFQQPFSRLSLLGGIGIGAFLLIFSILSRGGVGAGDGWLFCVTGMFLGFSENMFLLMTALLFSAGYALILLLKKQCGRKKEFAFLPFVLSAYMLFLFR